MLEELMKKSKERRETDKERYYNQDESLCMMCHAYGQDKRSLYISCFYAVYEVVPEAIDLSLTNRKEQGYYLRICKSCRSAFLKMMGDWRQNRIALRGVPKDHDGGIEYVVSSKKIPVRINGETVLMDEEEYERFKANG